MSGHVAPPALRVMTFNIRRRLAVTLRSADRWSARRHRVAMAVQQQHPTLLGVQEALPDQAAFLRSVLGDGYGCVGHGRERSGRGEGCPLFYDRRRLELLAWRQSALSAHPDLPGSRSWGSVFPRVVVEAEFRDRVTGRRLSVMNTHFDAFSPAARRQAADLVRRRVTRTSSPVVVVGDLNASPGSRAIGTLLAGDTLRDAWRVANRRTTPEWGTLADYRPPRTGQRIDWVLVSAGVDVETAAILGERVDGGWASDHLPVVVDLSIDGEDRTS